jgi:hypothetical protein
MAFGDYSEDAALREAWHRFCDQLRDAGDNVFKDHNPANALQRADAFRFLTQNLGQAFDLALETRCTPSARQPASSAVTLPISRTGRRG